jgi:hypothetical protein
MKKKDGPLVENSRAASCLSRRQMLLGISSILFLPACETKSMRIYLNISLFNYMERPIFDVYMSGTYFMGGAANGFYGAHGIMAMQPITLGEQTVSWKLDGPQGMARNGETVNSKNRPVLQDVPKNVKWLGLHIYPDETVELSLSTGSPDELQTQKGKKIIEAWEARKNER